MRVLIATTHRAVVGGVETYLRELLPALAACGQEVALLHEREAAGGQPVLDSQLPGLTRWWIEGPGSLRAVESWRPDVCYVQGLECPELEEGLLERFPAALFAHNYHGTCISGTKRYAVPGCKPCDRTLGPACLALYLPRRCGGLHPGTMWRHYRLQRKRLSLLSKYQNILVASRHMREEYLRHGVPEDRLVLAPLFPPGQNPDPQPPTARPCGGRVLLVGRLTELKGAHFLIHAMRIAAEQLRRPLTLVVAGDGPERQALEPQARQCGVPAEFHGWVDSTRRVELMRTADLLAVPSVWPEPFGLVGLEAGCVGFPAAGFAVGGIPDWLFPSTSGELAPGDPPTVAGLAAALYRALADDAHWHRLRLGAWETASRFTLADHCSRLFSVLEGVSCAPC